MNDKIQINLRDSLTGFDAKLAQAVVAMIAARAHLGAAADDLLTQILDYDLPYKPPTMGRSCAMPHFS